jgi:hypothetical protein
MFSDIKWRFYGLTKSNIRLKCSLAIGVFSLIKCIVNHAATIYQPSSIFLFHLQVQFKFGLAFAF